MKFTSRKIEKILKYLRYFETKNNRINAEFDIDFDFCSFGLVIQIDVKNIDDFLYDDLISFVRDWLIFHSAEIKYFEKRCSAETVDYIIDFKEF